MSRPSARTPLALGLLGITLAAWASVRLLSPAIPFWGARTDAEMAVFFDSFNVVEGRPQVLWQGAPQRVLGAAVISVGGLGPLDVEQWRLWMHVTGLALTLATVLVVALWRGVPVWAPAVAVLGHLAFPSASYYSALAAEDMFLFPTIALTLLLTWDALTRPRASGAAIIAAAALAGVTIAAKWTAPGVVFGLLCAFAMAGALDPRLTADARPYRGALVLVGGPLAVFAAWSLALRGQGESAVTPGVLLAAGLAFVAVAWRVGRPPLRPRRGAVVLGSVFAAVALAGYALSSFPLRERWRDVAYLARAVAVNSGAYGAGDADARAAAESLSANASLAASVAPLSLAFLGLATVATALVLWQRRSLPAGERAFGFGLIAALVGGTLMGIRPASFGVAEQDPGIVMRYLYPSAIVACVAILWVGRHAGPVAARTWVLATVVLGAMAIAEHGRTAAVRTEVWMERRELGALVERRRTEMSRELGRPAVVLDLALVTPAAWLMRYDLEYSYGAHMAEIRGAYAGHTLDRTSTSHDVLRRAVLSADEVIVSEGPLADEVRSLGLRGTWERIGARTIALRVAR